AEPNGFHGTEGTSVKLVNDVGTSVVGNEFGRKGVAVDAEGSDTLLVDQNKSHDATIDVTPVSGKVTGNTLTMKTSSGIRVNADPGAGLPDPFLVDGNTIHVQGGADGIDCDRVAVTISNNTLTGKGQGSGISASCGGDAGFSAGPVGIAGNSAKGFFTGIKFTCSATQSPTVSMSGDMATANKGFGFSVNVGPL